MSSSTTKNPEQRQEDEATKRQDTNRFYDGARQAGKPKRPSVPNSVFESYKP